MRALRQLLPLILVCVAPLTLRAQTPPPEPVTVAVLDFNAFSLTLEDAAAMGKGLAGMMITELSGRAGLRVIERQRIRQILNEQQMALSGRVDPATALEIGKLVGAQYLVTGSVALMPDKCRMDVRIFNVETGEIERAGKLMGAPDEFLAMVVEIADRLTRDLELEVPERTGEVARVPIEAIVAYSRGVAYADEGETERAAGMYREALEIFPDYRDAELALERLEAEGSR